MAEKMGIYKCEICGNIVRVLEAGAGQLVCCGEQMKLYEPKAVESEGKEKHVPIIEAGEGSIVVKVGSVDHPMADDHWIMWIELHVGGKVLVRRLNPGDAPRAEFCDCGPSEGAKAFAFCNKHGLWQS